MIAAPPAGAHDHGFDLPVLVGPVLLQVLLVAGGLVAVAAAGLRPFLGTPDRLTERAATLGAVGAGTALLLRAGPLEGMPTGGLAVLAIAGLAIPFAAVRRGRPRLRAAASLAAPFVLLVTAAAAVAAGTATGALFAAVVGLPWAVLLRPARLPVVPALAAAGAVVGVPLLLAGAALS